MPGTPCVFLKQWIDCKRDIKAMIDVRNAVGLHNESSTLNMATNKDYYAVRTEGKDNKYLVAVVGKQASTYTPNGAYTCILSGYHYAYWVSNNMETAWVDLPSGEYEGQQQAMLTAVSANSDALLVYTTDGTTPTASSTKVASGTKITIEGDMTLKVGLLIGSTVSGIVTRSYSSPVPTEKKTITVYVNTDNVGWSTVNFWTWGGDDSHSPSSGKWPGDKVSTTTTVSGKQWYSKQYVINGDDDFVNFVFSTNTGSPQTVDFNNVTTDKYFEISAQKNSDNKHLIDDVTSQYTDIQLVKANTLSNASVKVYTLDGRMLLQLPAGTNVSDAIGTLPHGLYLINGRKYVK
jgi:alpha-amylase